MTQFARPIASFTGIGVIFGPLAVLVVVRAIALGPAPPSAQAVVPMNPQPASSPLVAAPTAEQASALAWLAQWRPAPSIATPFFHPAPLEEEPDEPAEPEAPAPVAAQTPDPVFTVSTIVDAPGGALAVINGKIRRVGDEIVGGWTLAKIDARAKLVDLSSPDGRTIQRAPGPRPR